MGRFGHCPHMADLESREYGVFSPAGLLRTSSKNRIRNCNLLPKRCRSPGGGRTPGRWILLAKQRLSTDARALAVRLLRVGSARPVRAG